MMKTQLAKEQNVAWQTISHALRQHKVAHAYLFHGPSGTPKLEFAYLLAQSLVCASTDEDGYACETCSECTRIAGQTFSDLIVLDGTKTSIKKDHILKLQHEFNKTGLEHTGKKIYILNRAENATPDALNSLLKFLEEPTNDMIAILLVEQLDRLLPTIVSRCQLIPFHPLSAYDCFTLCKEELEELDAYLLSAMIRSPKEIKEAYESDEFQHARYLFQHFVEAFLRSPYYALDLLIREGFDGKKKRDGKRCMQYFLEMMMTFFKDVLQDGTLIEQEWYVAQLKHMRTKSYDVAKLLEILLSTRDKLWKSVNLSLLSDQMVYLMKEAVS